MRGEQRDFICSSLVKAIYHEAFRLRSAGNNLSLHDLHLVDLAQVWQLLIGFYSHY